MPQAQNVPPSPSAFTADAAQCLAAWETRAPGHGLVLFERCRTGWTVTASAGPIPATAQLEGVGARLFAAIEDWSADGLDLTARPVWRWAGHALGLRTKDAAGRPAAKAFAIRDQAALSAFPVAGVLIIAPIGVAEDSLGWADDFANDLNTLARENRERRRRDLLAVVGDRAGQGIAVADMRSPDLPILVSNQAFHRLSGYGDGTALALGGPLFEGVRLNEAVRQGLAQAMAHGDPFETELQVRRADGTVIWDALSLFSIEGSDGEPAYLVSTHLDMSARRMSEEERIRVRRLLLDAIESTSEGFMLLNQEEQVILVNSRYKELYPEIADRIRPGTSYDDILHAMVDEGLSPPGADRRAWIREQLQKLRAPALEGPREEALRDGRVIRISDRPTASGGIVSTRTDITALRRADDLSRLRLHAIEASRDGIAICDSDRTIVYANASMARLLGYRTAGDLTGQSLSVLHDRSEALRFEVEVMPALARERYWRGQAKGRRCDGDIFLQDITLTRLNDGALVCSARDITEQVRAAEERAALQAQFFQSQKMEAIGQLAGGIAHDFNNILSSILGYASFLTEDLEEGSELHDFAQTIMNSGQRAKALVRQILAFSRNEPAAREPGDLVGVIDETLDMLRATLPPDITLEANLSCGEARASFDATQINQVLMNLCVNARDAMDGNGTLKVALEAVDGTEACPSGETERKDGPDIQDRDDGALHLSTGGLEQAERYFRITVHDTGSGMPRAVMERMFEPFFTTKGKNEGTGLGLAAVHGIVLAHGGRIEILSRVGQGTAFSILLPATGAATLDNGDEGEAETHRRGTETILVIDDDLDVALMTERGLERLGYRVLAAGGAEAGLAVVRGETTAIDVLVTDQTMPGMGGLELIKTLRAEGHTIPAILYTGFAGDLDEEQALAGGADAFLRKPLEPGKLSRVIGLLMDQDQDQDQKKSGACREGSAAA